MAKPTFPLARAALFCCCYLLATACSSSESAQSTTASTTETVSPAPGGPNGAAKLSAPLKTWKARYLDGSPFDSTTLAGKKIIFGFFSYKNKAAAPMLKALEKLKTYESDYLFRIFAVSINHDEADAVKSFVNGAGFTIPVLVDNAGLEMATAAGIENEVTLVGMDNKHQPAFGLKKYVFADMPNGEEQFLNYMKENLKVREYHGAVPRLGLYPEAPDFSVKTLAGKEIKLSDYRGKAVLLIFFSPKCPHCQHEIKYLKDKFYPEFSKHGLEIIAASLLPAEGEILTTINSFGMTWPVIDDSTRAIRETYSMEMGVPENFFIDKEGKVRFHSGGFSGGSEYENLYAMQARALLGLDNPPMLSDKKFNGAESCMICHSAQYASWAVTPHAHAWETLEIKGEDFNTECASCHSIGMDDPRGWSPMKHPQTGKTIAHVPELFQNVQCEHCHGIGGPHLPQSKPLVGDELKNTCLKCHTEKFSLHFDYAERLAKVNHADAKKIAALSETERLELLKKVSKRPEDLFGAKIKYVGNDSCLSCHATEHDSWKNSVHGNKAVKSFTAASQDPLHPQVMGANCESCHGPGEKHVAAKSKSDIRGLGQDCPFCVIEQVCLSCHSPKNDADFNLVTDLEKIKGHK